MSEEIKNYGSQEEINASDELDKEMADLLIKIPDEGKRTEIFQLAYSEYLAPDNLLPLVDIVRKKVEEHLQSKAM